MAIIIQKLGTRIKKLRRRVELIQEKPSVKARLDLPLLAK